MYMNVYNSLCHKSDDKDKYIRLIFFFENLST